MTIKIKLTFVFLFLFSFTVYADNNESKIMNAVVEIAAEKETEEMKAVLESWIDKEKVKYFSKKSLSNEYVKDLYKEFRDTIVNPPKPDEYTEYTIPNANEALKKVEKLGKKMQNLFMGMSDKDFKRYGKFIAAMRETLYIDWKHIPYAINNNNARDIYWYEMHKIGVKGAEQEYRKVKNKE